MQEKQINLLNNIEGSGFHLLAIINDILDLFKIESGTMLVEAKDFNLTEFLNSLNSIFKLKCSQKPDINWILDDQCAHNLVVKGDQVN